MSSPRERPSPPAVLVPAGGATGGATGGEGGEEVPDAGTIQRIQEALAAGQLVGLPTETVYGLAARGDREEALDRLRRTKGRDDAPFTWHVADRHAVERFPELLPLARRLVERYWPGPLTLVLSGVPKGLEHVARAGWTGVRLPAHPATQAVLAAVDFPVVLSSANPSGGPPCTEAGRVAELFGDALALVLDGGTARLGEASGVLQLGPGTFELLREGLLPVEDLRRTAGLRLGFVCTGNTCRSPMAEALAKRILRRRLGLVGPASEHPAAGSSDDLGRFGFELESMGVAGGGGAPASPHAVDVMRAAGLDISAHRSRPAVPERVRELDRVYALTRSHLESLKGSLPPGTDVELHLLDPEGRDVPDPIGGSRQDYELCARRIEEALERRAEDWA